MKAKKPRKLPVAKRATLIARVVVVALLFVLFPFFINAVPGVGKGHPNGFAFAKGGSGGDGDSDGSDGGEGGDSDGSDGGEGGDDGGDDGDEGSGNGTGSNSEPENEGASPSQARALSSASRASGARQVSISQRGIEVIYNNGGRAEIRNGTYTFRGSSGQVVSRRLATGIDIALMRSIARGLSFESFKSREWSAIRVVRAKISRNRIKIVYSNGWTEQVRNNQYSLIDSFGRNVVRRPASPADSDRLRRASTQ